MSQSASQAPFSQKYQAAAMAGLSLAKPEISAIGVLFVGNCPADECGGTGLFHLQPLQHGR
jgi:hypothetical protein